MQILEIAKKINKANGKLYMVGGAVRDKILGIEPKDYDYAVTGISKETFIKLFPNANLRGKSFPVFDIEGSEFALARIEKKIDKGHKGFIIEANEKITIEEDLKRRDVTINSIAIDILENKIIDPFGGIEDIKNKILKATSNAFLEDPLRVYRVAKLASRFNFKVEENTLKMMNSLKDELKVLSNSRVYKELYDALSTEKPSIFFYVLRDASVLDVHFKEIYDLIGVEQPIEHHPEGDVYNHSMEVLDRCAKKTKIVYIRFAALVHDLGKAKTPKEEWPHHYMHDKVGDEVVRNMCNRLELPNIFKYSGMVSAREHMRASRFNEMRPSKKVDFLESINKTKLGLHGLEIIVNSDKERGENEIKFASLGEEMIKSINGKEIIDKTNFQKVKENIRTRRIEWIKERGSLYGL